jgi:probable O-glycosylation ligase (exosortase A-associated)
MPDKDTQESPQFSVGFGASRIISPIRVLEFLLIVLFLGAALTLAILPNMLQYAMIAAIPAIVVAITILRNVYLGVFYYFLFEFLRPVDFIPALGQLKIVMIIELLTLIAWLFYLIKNHVKIKWDNFNNLYLGFIVIMAVTIITAHNNRFAYYATQAIFVNFTIFLISINTVDSKIRLTKLIWLLLLIHLYYALKGIYNFTILGVVSAGQHTTGNTGGGFIGDENDFALALNVMIPFAYFYFMSFSSAIKKYFSLFLVLLFVLGVVASNSRGGWVGLMVILLFCIIRSKRKMLSLGIIGVILLAGAMFAPPDYWQQMSTISDTKESTAQTRIHYWKAAVRMYEDNPLFGVGAGNGPFRMPEYVQGFRSSATQWGRTFHGTLPQVLAELGTFGIGLYLFMIFYALKTLFRVRKQAIIAEDESIVTITNAITGSIIGYMACATFLSTAYYPQLWTLFVFTIIVKYLPLKNEPIPAA